MKLATIILAAGQGTRMKSRLPKVLHPVAGRAMIEEVIETARALNPAELVLVVGHGAEQVRDLVGDGVRYALQARQLGTGHAVAQARSLLEGRADTVLVLYGDTPLIRPETLRTLLARHTEANAAVTLLTFEPPDPTGYGRIVRDANGRVVAIVEHKDATEEQRRIRECNSGILAFRADWLWARLDDVPLSPQGEYYLTDMVALAVEDALPVAAIVAEDPEEVLGVNDRVQLATATRVLLNRRREALMRAGVTLVQPETVFIGPHVRVGRDTLIEPHVHLDGLTIIGEENYIGPFTHLSNVTTGRGCLLSGVRLYNRDFADGVKLVGEENGIPIG
ncbi:bifunctional UDP-N-acetylglucosamine pyrophosphorylase / Glucosamine-1-phosphate N-acetyltransferase [Ardenticatena maritima]|uniref:Bifunctional UDP-N-acetylglucosamine pyrophosphorylase / Glucosamine-1-phosphate N-acetyltransferase n=1 Tax=Ardenticatena maritima TaxID=872965 RepID=A0A0M8K5X7_9CHLR|nr:NTP transferase domain-containing protein [Ardenticatena maritima]GAP62415.1 bifunctional UDP-N-acetylglucosamine pyrophosphorylase / Glucosamine-1-phosphate N-acetyltransferase [Ardenticatena maritima]